MINTEYKQHRIFKEIEKYEEFYSNLSNNVMSFLNGATNGIINIDTYIYSSIKGTLESIKIILANARINDAYALLRKYYDSVIINAYVMLFIEDNKYNEEFFFENKIDDWVKGKEKLPDYRTMNQYLMNSVRIKDINNLIYNDSKFKEIRNRCNNNTHYNIFYYVILNDNEIHNEERVHHLNMFSDDLLNLFILHLAYTFTINDQYLSSSDYIDYLDAKQTPPENSEYWVAPFIQEIFDSIIKIKRPDIAQEIKKNTYMHLE